MSEEYSPTDIVLNLLEPSDIKTPEMLSRYENRRKFKNNPTPAEIIRNLSPKELENVDKVIFNLRRTNDLMERFEKTNDGSENVSYIRTMISARNTMNKINPKTEDADELLGETSEAVIKKYKTERGFRDYLFYKSINPEILDTNNENALKLKQKIEKKIGNENEYSYDDFKKELAFAGPEDLSSVYKRLKKLDSNIFKQGQKYGTYNTYFISSTLPYIDALIRLKTAKQTKVEFDDAEQRREMERSEIERRLRRREQTRRNRERRRGDEGYNDDIWDE